MTEKQRNKLLDIPEVIDEVNRHLWIESEKAGHDIGFEEASRDWIEKYSKEWLSYYMPQKAQILFKEVTPKKRLAKEEDGEKKRTRGRAAKSFAK